MSSPFPSLSPLFIPAIYTSQPSLPMAILITTRKISVALLLLAILGVSAAPLSVAGQNATEQHLERREKPTHIYVRREQHSWPDKEYPTILLGSRQALNLEPEEAQTTSNQYSRSDTGSYWETVLAHSSGPGSWWEIKPSYAGARSSPKYLDLGALVLHDLAMKTLLLGNDNRDLGGNFLIHSRLHSDGGSDKNPTRQMRIDAAHAMVERIRTLDSFFEGLKAHDPVLRAKYEELQAKRAQDEDTNSRAEKEAIDREDQEGRHANKKQKADESSQFKITQAVTQTSV
ncbi:hypothetical protein EV361DRAFT_955936 [Lentinula raphanica]|nr:hypothetical protein EV361DRAFT_955936 [Lentinula raphanica]